VELEVVVALIAAMTALVTALFSAVFSSYTQLRVTRVSIERFRLADSDFGLFCLYVLAAKQILYEVEPRGFEPLTSAVQRRFGRFTNVRGRSDTTENRRNTWCGLLYMFACVHPGWRRGWRQPAVVTRCLQS
jgi:hypothetical protein